MLEQDIEHLQLR